MLTKKALDRLLSPWTVLTGIVLGLLIGLKSQALSSAIAPFGEVYLALLQMCILPIMISAIVSSLAKILLSGVSKSYLKRIFLVFALGLMTASVVGLLAGFIFKPGAGLGDKARTTLGKTISQAELSGAETAVSPRAGLVNFFVRMVPSNIFSAIVQNQNLSILVVSIIVGFALGLTDAARAKTTLAVIETVYELFLKIISWAMYILPFGLCSLIADQVSRIGAGIMLALLKLIMVCYAGAFVLIILYGIVLWRRIGGSFFRSFAALKESFVIALGTSSSYAAIPSAMRGLHENLKIDEATTKLVIPLGVSMNPHGSVLHFAVCTIFMAQLYNVPMSSEGLVIALIGSVLAGMAATGAPGTGGLIMIGLVLEPLGLPLAVAVIILSAIDPIIDPILTLLNIHANCAAAALVAECPGTTVSGLTQSPITPSPKA